MSGKLPSFQFYPGDWLKDPALRACSPAARGFWIDLLCLMFECPKRGVLKTGKRVWGELEISNALQFDPKTAQELLQELMRNGVLRKRRIDGAYFSKRLVSDEKRRAYDRGRKKSQRIPGDVPRMSHRSSSSSSSSSSKQSSSDDDPLTLLPELQAKYPSYQLTAADVEWAASVIRERATSPPGSGAYWRKALFAFMENADGEIAAHRKQQAGAVEAHAGHNYAQEQLERARRAN